MLSTVPPSLADEQDASFGDTTRAGERAEFAKLVNDVISAGKASEEELCDMFEASLPAVRSWRLGTAMPRPTLRHQAMVQLRRFL